MLGRRPILGGVRGCILLEQNSAVDIVHGVFTVGEVSLEIHVTPMVVR